MLLLFRDSFCLTPAFYSLRIQPQIPPSAFNMGTIMLREAVTADIEPMARLAIAAFKDDPLVAVFSPPSLRVGKEEAAIEDRMGLYHKTLAPNTQHGIKFVVAVEDDEIVSWAEWEFASTSAKDDDNADGNDDDTSHLAGVLEMNEQGPFFFSSICRSFLPIHIPNR